MYSMVNFQEYISMQTAPRLQNSITNLSEPRVCSFTMRHVPKGNHHTTPNTCFQFCLFLNQKQNHEHVCACVRVLRHSIMYKICPQGYATFYSNVDDNQFITSQFETLRNSAAVNIFYIFWNVYSFFLGLTLVVEFLDHEGCICSALVDIEQQFSKVIVLVFSLMKVIQVCGSLYFMSSLT